MAFFAKNNAQQELSAETIEYLVKKGKEYRELLKNEGRD
jgi:hypothetical protein